METPCPVCDGTGVLRSEHHMEAAELKAIRGMIGVRFGYRGPMPGRRFAPWIGISERTLNHYERGKRKLPDGKWRRVEIPDHIARKVRGMLNDPTLTLPKKWGRIRDQNNTRSDYWAKRKQQRDQRRTSPDPPF